MPIVLVGAPGAGKSTIGAGLAKAFGLSFFDSDTEIERVLGKPVSQVFIEDGEPLFRQIESQVVSEALKTQKGVISLGGGAVLDVDIRSSLSKHQVCWLQVSSSAAASRIGLDKPRPVLLGNVRASLIKLLAQRSPLYAQVATCIVDTDNKEPHVLIDELSEILSLSSGQN